ERRRSTPPAHLPLCSGHERRGAHVRQRTARNAQPAKAARLLHLRRRTAFWRARHRRLLVREPHPTEPRAAVAVSGHGLSARRARHLLRLVLVAWRPDTGDEDLAYPRGDP